MNPDDVILDEMGSFRNMNERDIERLFAGHAPSEEPGFDEVAEFFEDFAHAYPVVSTEHCEAAHVSAMVEAVQLLADKGEPVARPASKANGPAEQASGLPKPRRSTMWRIAQVRLAVKVIVPLVVVFAAFTGVAYAADGAVPGDALYGLDRALENGGLGNGGLQERLGEAGTLIDDGHVDEGLNLAAEALTEEEDEDDDGDVDEEDGEIENDSSRSEALLAAAAAVLASGSEQSLEVRTRVAAKLTFMASTELTGREYGQAVSQLARGIFDEEQEGQDADNTGENGKNKTNNGKANGHSK